MHQKYQLHAKNLQMQNFLLFRCRKLVQLQRRLRDELHQQVEIRFPQL